ncbi:Nse1 non-SMC component of SMC5-6 complex-domain-containing protein [Tricladium varicosporioides]|nr:Nse1 non-SMC component of SMC5-6 complex-domain-containing protein [Hymenoscyphus varicosporioides]
MDIDPDDPHGNYDDGNRAFLQGFLGRGQLTFEEGREILAAIFTIQSQEEVTPEHVTQADFDSFISAAADTLSQFDYEIRTAQHQLTKERTYAIVNSVSDAMTQLATTRTTEEMHYIKRLLDAMFETYNTRRREVMAVTSMQAMEKKVLKPEIRPTDDDETTVDKGLTGGEAEKLLQKLEAEKWLERSRQGFYSLTPRALMELRGWLLDAYNEPLAEGENPEEVWQRIKFCEACKDIITTGQRCAALECNVRIHDICGAAFWNSRPNKQCPRCETEWDGKYFVGQKAVTTTEEYLKGKRRSGGATKRSRPADDEGESGEAENETRTHSQTNGRRRRPVSPELEEEVYEDDE